MFLLLAVVLRRGRLKSQKVPNARPADCHALAGWFWTCRKTPSGRKIPFMEGMSGAFRLSLGLRSDVPASRLF